jgi:hypothetical protein
MPAITRIAAMIHKIVATPSVAASMPIMVPPLMGVPWSAIRVRQLLNAGTMYQARNARIASTMMTIAVYLIAA